MVKRIEKEWALYSTLIPMGAAESQVRETKRAFYGGAQTLLAIIMRMLDPGTEPTEADLRKMDEIDRELRDFLEQVKRGAA